MFSPNVVGDGKSSRILEFATVIIVMEFTLYVARTDFRFQSGPPGPHRYQTACLKSHGLLRSYN